MVKKDHSFVKIINVRSEIVVRMLDYIESLTYSTYSKSLKQNLMRNSFKILKLEGTPNGTNIWLEGFGRMREHRFEGLKIFAKRTEELYDERHKCAQIHKE